MSGATAAALDREALDRKASSESGVTTARAEMSTRAEAATEGGGAAPFALASSRRAYVQPALAVGAPPAPSARATGAGAFLTGLIAALRKTAAGTEPRPQVPAGSDSWAAAQDQPSPPSAPSAPPPGLEEHDVIPDSAPDSELSGGSSGGGRRSGGGGRCGGGGGLAAFAAAAVDAARMPPPPQQRQQRAAEASPSPGLDIARLGKCASFVPLCLALFDSSYLSIISN